MERYPTSESANQPKGGQEADSSAVVAEKRNETAILANKIADKFSSEDELRKYVEDNRGKSDDAETNKALEILHRKYSTEYKTLKSQAEELKELGIIDKAKTGRDDRIYAYGPKEKNDRVVQLSNKDIENLHDYKDTILELEDEYGEQRANELNQNWFDNLSKEDQERVLSGENDSIMSESRLDWLNNQRKKIENDESYDDDLADYYRLRQELEAEEGSDNQVEAREDEVEKKKSLREFFRRLGKPVVKLMALVALGTFLFTGSGSESKDKGSEGAATAPQTEAAGEAFDESGDSLLDLEAAEQGMNESEKAEYDTSEINYLGNFFTYNESNGTYEANPNKVTDYSYTEALPRGTTTEDAYEAYLQLAAVSPEAATDYAINWLTPEQKMELGIYEMDTIQLEEYMADPDFRAEVIESLRKTVDSSELSQAVVTGYYNTYYMRPVNGVMRGMTSLDEVEMELVYQVGKYQEEMRVTIMRTQDGRTVITSMECSQDQDKMETTSTPEIPQITEDTPETPDTPDIPDTPETPDTPDIPDTPETPEIPDTPTPKNPEEDINQNPDLNPEAGDTGGGHEVDNGEGTEQTPAPVLEPAPVIVQPEEIPEQPNGIEDGQIAEGAVETPSTPEIPPEDAASGEIAEGEVSE